MFQTVSDNLLADQLLRVAREPELREAVYERLGEYCHQCRNRLNSLKLSLYLVMRQSPGSAGGQWAAVDRHYQELERRVEQIQFLCRPLKLTIVSLGLELLIDDRRKRWSEQMARSGKTLEFDGPAERTVAGFDVDRLGQALDSLIAWRAGEPEAGASAKLRWWAESGSIHLVWEESGGPSDPTIIPADSSDATWTLPFLARIIQAHQGDFQVRNERGYRLELSWPTVSSQP